jgi:hypothetical protein
MYVKTVHALDCAATVNGYNSLVDYITFGRINDFTRQVTMTNQLLS